MNLPKNRSSLIKLIIALVLIGLVVYAGLNSSGFISRNGPTISQQSVKDKLKAKSQSSPPSKPSSLAEPSKPQPSKPQPAKPQTATPATPSTPAPTQPNAQNNLSNSGPGEVIAVFSVATLAGMGVSYFRILRYKYAR